MIVPHEHTNVTLSKSVARKGGAAKNAVATLASASEAEQAAKSPIAGVTDKNFIKNSLFDQDQHYPGAGGRVEDWAGFSASPLQQDGTTPTTTYPITYTVASGSKYIQISGMPGGATSSDRNFIVRITLQNTAYPGTSYTISKDITYTSSDPTSAPFLRTATISDVDILALGIGNTATFQSVIFTILDANGNPKPGSETRLLAFEIAFYGTDNGKKPIERYNIYGGATIASGSFMGVTPYSELAVPDDSLYGHPYTKASVNGVGSTWNGNRMPAEWRHYCGLYCHALAGNNYDTFFGKRFYRIRKNKNEYEDIASLHSPTTASADGGYDLGPLQSRFIEIFPSGGLITKRDDATVPQTNATRTFPDISAVGLHTDATFTTSWTARDKWIKHSVCQSVKIPDNAAYCEYGAYVQVPQDPAAGPGGPNGGFAQLSSYNFVSIQCSQDYGPGLNETPSATNPRVIRGDAIRIISNSIGTASKLAASPVLITSDVARYNWNGLASVYNPSLTESVIDANLNNQGPNYTNGFRWPTTVAYTAGNFDVEDYTEFKFVGRSWSTYSFNNTQSGWYKESDLSSSLSGESYWPTIQKQLKYLQLELIHYEYRRDNIDPTPVGGKARFFNPSIQFFDSNNNIISPS